jgi:hypothetical protein
MRICTSTTTCLLLISVLLAGCGPFSAGEVNDAQGARAWFDAPLPNTVILPPNPCQLVAHAASPLGIVLFELSINDNAPIQINSPDTESSLVTLSQDCGVSAPGTYELRLRAEDNAGAWSNFAETTVIIAGDEGEGQDITDTSQPVDATETPTPQACMWTAAINVFVRKGPDSSGYEAVWSMTPGEGALVIGQSLDGFWWSLDTQGGIGYVPKEARFGSTSGDCEGLPQFTPGPTITPTFTPTPGLTQCNDGIDNDADGSIDLADTGCSDAYDNSEAFDDE